MTKVINTDPPRQRRIDRTRRSTNLEQTNLNGDSIAAKDSDTFGNISRTTQ